MLTFIDASQNIVFVVKKAYIYLNDQIPTDVHPKMKVLSQLAHCMSIHICRTKRCFEEHWEPN